jgi:hypothetical protein
MSDAETKEWERLAFVAGRDGVSAATAFAQQGFRQYTAAIREADSGGNQYGAAYRDSLNASITVYQSYMTKNE